MRTRTDAPPAASAPEHSGRWGWESGSTLILGVIPICVSAHLLPSLTLPAPTPFPPFPFSTVYDPMPPPSVLGLLTAYAPTIGGIPPFINPSALGWMLMLIHITCYYQQHCTEHPCTSAACTGELWSLLTTPGPIHGPVHQHQMGAC